ncbi:MAG: DNA-directed RNA polymerase subunit omega [Opitutaceae bacterium]|nr:DNA-directed RNA polymerase subunit omega [Opitutaceae bacterium]
MRDDYLNEALKVVIDPNLLVNLVSRRVKQLRRGGRPLIESLEKLALEDVALREIYKGKITWEVPDMFDGEDS